MQDSLVDLQQGATWNVVIPNKHTGQLNTYVDWTSRWHGDKQDARLWQLLNGCSRCGKGSIPNVVCSMHITAVCIFGLADGSVMTSVSRLYGGGAKSAGKLRHA